MGRGIQLASDEHIEIERRLDRDDEREPRIRRPRERAWREAAWIRYLKVGAR